MTKKKAIKVIAASAIAASSFAAVAPNNADAASKSISTQVKESKTTMRNAMVAYYDAPSYVKASVMEKHIQKAKDSYNKTKANVKKSKYSYKQRLAWVTDLTKTYKKYVGNAVKYQNAIKAAYAAKLDILKQLEAANAAVTAKDLAKAEEAVAAINKALEDQAYAIKAGVVGAAPEGHVLAAYNAPLAAQAETLAADVAKLKEELATPAVQSVSAINNKTLVVKFNKEIDENTLNTTNIARSGSGTAAFSSGTVYQLSTDKKTVTVFLSTAAAQQEKVEVVVKDVKTTDGSTVPTYKQDVVFFDNAAPEVSDVKVTGKNTVKVYFSEALAVAPTAKITMNNVVYQPAVSLNSTGTEGTITLPVDMVDGNHSIEVSGGQDFAQSPGFGINKVTKQFTYVKDTTAVKATVKTSTETSVTLKFNKPIPDISSNAVAQYLVFSHGYKGYNAVTNNGTAFSGGSVTKIADDEYKVTFNQPLAPGATTLYFDYAANTADANKVKDGFGNILEPFTVTVNTSADFVKPVLNNVEFKDANTLKVVYSEVVNDASTSGANSATNPANYVLKDADGKIVNVSSIANPSGDHKTFELTTSTLNGGTYTLEVKNVADVSVAANKIDTVTKSFVATDKVAPTVNTAATVLGTKKIKIKFSEAMDKASIEDKSMYNVDSKVKITASADNKSVVLDYTDVTGSIDFTTGGPTTIQVGQVKDAAGNKTSNFVTSVTVTHTAATVVLDKVEAVSLTKLKLYVDDVVTVNASAKIAVSADNGTNYTLANIESSTIIGGQTIITVEVPAAIALAAGNTEVAGVKVATGTVSGTTLTPGSISGITNADGAQLNIVATTVEDKVGPSVVSRTTKDLDADGKIDAVEVVFSENLFAGSVTASDFQVEGYVIEGVSSIVNGSGNATVTLALKEGANNDTAATPKVTVSGQVEDLLRNASTAESTATAAVDGAAAVITSAVYNLVGAAHKVVITFSEAVTDESATPAAIASGDILFTDGGAGSATISTVAHVLGSNTVELTLSAAPTAGATVNAVATKVEDAAGNASATTTKTISGL
ncbi:Ig-like domain-containing protein [Bacillus massilinigeriensis]|uniref:Ig-like domain-containing protein n=1 Tax=Bacillus massilionigeriensis TaxID=1805475 RepID=UPI00096B2BE1|nr:Ig-like domain-containing protein [Bacillus massilionigeriensis]